MKHRLFSQITSLIVVISLLLTGTILPISATTVSDVIDSSNDPIRDDNLAKNNNLLISDEIILHSDDSSIAKESMILKYVDSSQFNAAKHTQRLADLEDLNTYVFANADGTRSIYLMHENVKYVDQNGIVKEKDISLKSMANGFGIARSDIDLLIPNNPVQGIDLEYSGFAVKLIPQGLASATSAVQTDNSVVYDKAYGENTKLKYTPILSGVKEDIILTEYTANAAYTFIIETDGLSLYSNGNSYYLADGDKSDPVFRLGEIIIYDAIGKPDIGSMTVETISEGQKYLLTVTANDDFLSDPNTVYPVIIDPSITVSDNTHEANAIEDAPIFEGYPNTNCGAFLYNRVGTPNSTYKIGRTVVKLSGLINHSEYQTIAASQIINVTFYAKESSGGSKQFINLYPLTSNTTWTESTVTWNNIGSYTTEVNYGATMYNNQWTAFDITNLVKAWKNGTYSANAGFIMTNEDETGNNKSFDSSECSTFANLPYVVMTCTTDISLNYTNTSIVEGGTKTLVATTNPSGQTVTWSTSNSTVASVSSSGVVTANKAGKATITASTVDSDGETCYVTCTVYVYISNGVYYIQNAKTGLYLNVTNGINNLTNVNQYPIYPDSDSESDRIKQMWKTYYLGNGHYTIRPMHKLDMGLDVTNDNVDIYDIGTSDTFSDTPDYGQWTINWYSNGYVFRNNGNGDLTMQVKDTLVPFSFNVVASAYSKTGLNCRWILTKIPSPPSGILLYDTSTGLPTTSPTKTINPKDKFSLSELNLKVAVYSGTTNSQSVYWYSNNPGVATVDGSDGTVTGVSRGTATIIGRRSINGTYYYVSYQVNVNNNAVIIVPGILGTELVAGWSNSSYEEGTKLWSTDLIDDYNSGNLSQSELIDRIISLRCDNDGHTQDHIIPYNNTYGAGNVYQSLYNSLCNEYQDEYSIRFFAYDWRLSNSDSANSLDQFINYYSYDNVILVCHSMGGLVASKYLSLGSAQRDKVKTVITLGSPLLGTPVVPYLWGSEDVNVTGMLDNMGIPGWATTLIDLVALLYDPLDYLMGNFSSMYEMFPSEKYFDSSFAGKNYLITSIAGISHNTITTYADTRQRLNSYLNHFNTNLADAAELFHNSLYINGNHVTSLVNTYYIAGYGHETVDMVKFNMWDWYVDSTTDEGDELVAVWSATLGDKYSSRTFYAENVNHTNLVYNYYVQNFVIQLIGGNTSIPSSGIIKTDIQQK